MAAQEKTQTGVTSGGPGGTSLAKPPEPLEEDQRDKLEHYGAPEMLTPELRQRAVAAAGAHIRGALWPMNLMSHNSMPDWKIVRYPYLEAGALTYDKIFPGALGKFNAARTMIQGCATGDAAPDCVILDLPDPDDVNKTVAVALQGSFNSNRIFYADVELTDRTTQLGFTNVATRKRLHDIGIFLDPAVPYGTLGHASPFYDDNPIEKQDRQPIEAVKPQSLSTGQAAAPQEEKK